MLRDKAAHLGRSCLGRGKEPLWHALEWFDDPWAARVVLVVGPAGRRGGACPDRQVPSGHAEGDVGVGR